MRLSIASSLVLFGVAATVTAAASIGVPPPDKDGKYTIEAEGIRAQFIPYGASITNLFIKDKHGVERDIVMGFDNATYYQKDKLHPHLGGVPGRYANRIRNGTFTIDGVTSHTSQNNKGNTLHGGADGWDYRQFTIDAYNKDSITFSIVDPAGSQGFPGKVTAQIHYWVTPHQWHFRMTAQSLTEKTPIMLTSHTYWNLDGFQNPDDPTANAHTLHLPYSGQRIEVDGNLIPTGPIISNPPASINDFWSHPNPLGASLASADALGNCGTNCTGYDTCFLVDRSLSNPYDWLTLGPIATLSSPFSGISLAVFSDQQAYQLYNCAGMNSTFPLKKTQGFFGGEARIHPRVVPKYGCVVMEVQDWIDSVNHPAWQRGKRNIFGPGDRPYELEAVYSFSTAYSA